MFGEVEHVSGKAEHAFVKEEHVFAQAAHVIAAAGHVTEEAERGFEVAIRVEIEIVVVHQTEEVIHDDLEVRVGSVDREIEVICCGRGNEICEEVRHGYCEEYEC